MVDHDKAGGYSSTDQGGGKQRLFGDVDPAEAESLCNRFCYARSSVQNLIDVALGHAMKPRKSGLTAFLFDYGSQETHDLTFVQYKRAAALAASEQNRSFPVIRPTGLRHGAGLRPAKALALPIQSQGGGKRRAVMRCFGQP
jgi:hypothetical protein